MQVVEEVNPPAIQLNCFCGWQLRTPFVAFVDVAADRRERGDLTKGLKNVEFADITGMQNMVDTLKGLNRFACLPSSTVKRVTRVKSSPCSSTSFTNASFSDGKSFDFLLPNILCLPVSNCFNVPSRLSNAAMV